MFRKPISTALSGGIQLDGSPSKTIQFSNWLFISYLIIR